MGYIKNVGKMKRDLAKLRGVNKIYMDYGRFISL